MSRNFDRLKAHIVELSASDDFDVARQEWDLAGIEISDESDHCPCGQEIREHCFIANRKNENKTYVGNVCIQRFIGLKTATLFAGLKRIKANPKAKPNEALIVHAQRSGYLFEKEEKFLMSIRNRRSLTSRQVAWKDKIVARILKGTIVRRRGQGPR